jgi:hypothetical protein
MNNQGTMLHPMECKCISWKPIVAGALAAIGFTFLLNLFSVAIGLTAFTTNDQGVENLAIGGLLATALGIVVSMFAAGWIAGYLGHRHCTKRHLGALYGFLVWCVALIVMMFIATSFQSYVTLYTHFISGTTVHLAMAHADTVAPHTVAHLAIPVPPVNQVMISAYIVFSLFFLSAFASSLGGHCGMRHEC